MFNVNWVSRRDVDKGFSALGSLLAVGSAILLLLAPFIALMALAIWVDPLGFLPPVGEVFANEDPVRVDHWGRPDTYEEAPSPSEQYPGFLQRVILSLGVMVVIAVVVIVAALAALALLFDRTQWFLDRVGGRFASKRYRANREAHRNNFVKCEFCRKSFTHSGLVRHRQAEHGMDLPRSEPQRAKP